MIKVIIVDDNKIERERLIDCIDWNRAGAEIIGETNNGYTALEMILRCPPDVLITDIKMPQMSGIELAGKTLALFPSVKVIFLTGYEEFELAKEAVNLNASGYITKPVSTPEFCDILNKVIDLKISSNLSAEKEKNLRRQLEETRPVLKESFIKDLVLGREIMNECRLKEKSEFLDLKFRDGSFAVFVLQFDDYDIAFDSLPEGAKHIRLIEISGIVGSVVREHFKCFYIVKHCNYRYGYQLSVLLNFDPDCGIEALYGQIGHICGSIQFKVKSECGLLTTIGISGMGRELSEIYILREQAELAARYKFFKGKGNIIRYGDVHREADTYPMDHLIFEGEIASSLRLGEALSISDTIDGFFNKMSDSGVSMQHIRNASIDVMCSVKRILTEAGEDINLLLKDMPILYDTVFHMETIADIRDYIKELCISIVRKINENRKDIQSIRVEKIIDFLNANIDKNITAEDIAGYLFLTQNYVRRIFKEKTGENIHEYFTRLKIERAKKMLCDSKLKIHEIAKKIGYESTSYFCLVFKGFTDYTPKEYKEKFG